MAPVAADIMAGLPPTKDIITAIQKEAYKPTIGSTPAIMEKAIASGINAKATVTPERMSILVFENHEFLICCIKTLNPPMDIDMGDFSLSEKSGPIFTSMYYT
ncbi:hypothetical protein D3C73_996370 [compost metagenome]